MKNINYKKIILVLLNSFHLLSDAQIIDSSYIAQYDSLHEFYVFKNNIYESGTNLFKPNTFKMSDDLKLQLIKSKTDDLNFIHRKYYQTLNNVPIIGTEFVTHENEIMNKYTANGKLINFLSINTNPQITYEEAINFAISNDGSEKYYWQDSVIEMGALSDSLNIDSLYYPIQQIFIINSTPLNVNPSYVLVYKVRLYARTPIQKTVDYYINANSGRLVLQTDVSASNCFSHNQDNPIKTKENDNLINIPADISSCPQDCNNGTADVKFYGSQYITTDRFNYGVFCRYRTKSSCPGLTFIYVQKVGSTDYRNSTNNWGNTYQSATSALFCIQATHDFYRNYFNRNSFDNSFSQINVFPEDASISGNASWNGSNIHIGTFGAPFSDELLTLDVLGHEFTHGVNDHEANLTYSGESGALDESFADIFGIMIEFYGKQTYYTGLSPNYIIGEEVGTLRDMSNPNSKNQPNTYNGIYWANTALAIDNGGVHTNSGVQNFWFYLLSEGGSGINDNGNSYCVSAIGRDKASKIAYRNLTTYLVANSTYVDARFYSIQSAIDLYGVNSNEVAQVTAAWYAVGVGSQFNDQVDIKNVTINSPQSYHYNAKVLLQNVITNPTAGLIVTSNTEIELLPEISFNSGSENELYITPACLGGARMANSNSNSNQNSENEQIQKKLESSSKVQNDFNVMPNPTTGFFKLLANKELAYPKLITIHNVLGQIIYKIENPNSFEYEFNLIKENSGIYIINVFYDNTVMSKRIIKE